MAPFAWFRHGCTRKICLLILISFSVVHSRAISESGSALRLSGQYHAYTHSCLPADECVPPKCTCPIDMSSMLAQPKHTYSIPSSPHGLQQAGQGDGNELRLVRCAELGRHEIAHTSNKHVLDLDDELMDDEPLPVVENRQDQSQETPSPQEPQLPPMSSPVPASSSAFGPSPAPENASPGSFTVVGDSGVPVMHAALMPNGRVIFLDKVENFTQLKLPNGQYAYSAEYDPATGKVVPLSYKSNAFCCAGSFLADGRLLSLGGNGPLSYLDPTVGDGFSGIRYIGRSSTDSSLDGQSWSEPGHLLSSRRWYASSLTMPDGSILMVSGSLNSHEPLIHENNNPTWEILDAGGVSLGWSLPMEILQRNQPVFMYPFLHLLSDGTVFVSVSQSAQTFNVSNKKAVRDLPALPGMYRTYPLTGGSVMLPLLSDNQYEPEIMICGGSSFQHPHSPTDASCGRIRPLANDPSWEMDAMPEGRLMVEGQLLPDGTVLWINGAQRGNQGFGIADTPALEALIYDPAAEPGKRWSTAGRSEIARLYHSIALLLLDGTVLVAGSNPNEMPILFQNVDLTMPERAYPTEFRMEIYTPPYLMGDRATRRPKSVEISSIRLKADGGEFQVSFLAPELSQHVKILLYHGGFVTHSLHMGQRMVVLDHTGWNVGVVQQTLRVRMPAQNFGAKVLPPGPYILFVVVDGVPALGQFVMVG